MWVRGTLAVVIVCAVGLVVYILWNGREAPERGAPPVASAPAIAPAFVRPDAFVPAAASAGPVWSAPSAPSVDHKPEQLDLTPGRHWEEKDGSYFAVSSEKARDLTTRQEWRAFMGAPPVMPHKMEKLDICGNCHDEGSDLPEGVAGKRPHDNWVDCTQCHVEALSERFTDVVDPPSTFRGQPEPIGGPRAFIGAPPAIPHATDMRSKCLGCHGPLGLPAIRTPHPERTDCRQCHATIAAIEMKL